MKNPKSKKLQRISLTCIINVSTKTLLKNLTESMGVSQGSIVEKGIQLLAESQSKDDHQHPGGTTSTNSHHSDEVEFFREELLFKNKTIEEKDYQIRKLLESISQQNHLLAILGSKKDDKLIEQKDIESSSVMEDSTKPYKKNKKKGKGKKK